MNIIYVFRISDDKVEAVIDQGQLMDAIEISEPVLPQFIDPNTGWLDEIEGELIRKQ